MAHALQIDTLAFSEKLQAAGADVLLAKAIVEGISSADTSTLATKEDLRNVETTLKSDIAEVRGEIAEVRGEIKDVEAALKSDIAQVEAAMKLEIAEVKTEIAKTANTITTRLGAIITVMLGVVGALQFFA